MPASYMGGDMKMFTASSVFKKRLQPRPQFDPSMFQPDPMQNEYEINPPRSIKLGLLLDDYTGEVIGDFQLPLPKESSEPAIAIVGGSGSGKCLGKGTKIVMYDGSLKCVEDLQIGDKLMGVDSTPRTILSTCHGYDKMYKISQNKGIDYIVNEPHILSLKKSKSCKNPNCLRYSEYPEIVNISVKDYLQKDKTWKAKFRGYKVAVEFEEKSIEIDPYFLGLWLGDDESKNIEITTPDIEIIEYLNDFAIKNNLNIHKQIYKNNKSDRYALNKDLGNISPLRESFKKYNLLKNKHIPNEYLYNTKEIRLQLLAGLIDTDGYLDSNCSYVIVQKSKILAEQIVYLANSLGLRTNIRMSKGKIKSLNYENDYYKITISGQIEFPLKVKRKQIKNRVFHRDLTTSGLKVEYIGIDEYYGFTLDGDRLFLLEDFTVTHNTITVTRLVDELRRNFGRPVLIFDAKNQYSSMTLPNQNVIHCKILEENGEKPEGVENLKTYIPKNMVKKYGEFVCKDRYNYTNLWKIKTSDIDATGMLMLGQKATSDRDYVMSLSGVVDSLKEIERNDGIPFTMDSLMQTLQSEIERISAKKRSLEPLIAMFDNLIQAGMLGDDGNDVLELMHKPYVRILDSPEGYVYKTKKAGDVSIFNTCGTPNNISVRGFITNIFNALSNKLIYCYDKKTKLPEYRPIIVVEEASMFYGKYSDGDMIEAIGQMMDVFGRSAGVTRILMYQFKEQAISGLFENDNLNIIIEMFSSIKLKDPETNERTGRQIAKKGLAVVKIRNVDFMPDWEFLVQILPPKCNVQS